MSTTDDAPRCYACGPMAYNTGWDRFECRHQVVTAEEVEVW